MSDAVMVPREPTEAMLEAFYGAVVVMPTGTILGFLDGWEAMLAASPSVGGWERTDIQRLMNPVRTYLVDKCVTQRVAEEASERAVDAMYRALNAPPPVSTGSRPQEAAPADLAVVAREALALLEELWLPEDAGLNDTDSAQLARFRVRLPEVIDALSDALTPQSTPQPADGCSSNEGEA